MKYKRLYITLLGLLIFNIHHTFAQDPPGPHPKRPRTPDDYKAGTLKTLALKGSDSRTNKEETMLVYDDILPTRVRVTYAGSARPIPQIKKEVLRQWARLYAGVPESYTEPYETEMLFIEKGDEHWLAVRKDVLPRLKQSLREREEMDLYLIRVGGALVLRTWEPLLLVENFQKPN